MSSSNNNIFINLIDDDNPAGEERRDVLGPRHDPRRPIRKLAPRCSRLEPLKKPILGNSDSGNLKIIVSHGHVKHSYPFCWRSDTPLLYRAVPAWFMRVQQVSLGCNLVVMSWL